MTNNAAGRRLRARLAIASLAGLGVLGLHGPAAAAEDEPVQIALIVAVLIIGLVVPLLFWGVWRISQINRSEMEAADDEEPVVAGIEQGSAPVPRWLYAVYILIPLWAAAYVIGGSDIPGEVPAAAPAATPTPEATPAPAVTPAPDGPIRMVARNIQFDTDEIHMRAGQDVEIILDNQDPATPHNVSIYTDDTMAEAIFVGDLFPGPAQRTYELTAPDEPGTYFFVCDVHIPTMQGDVIVE